MTDTGRTIEEYHLQQIHSIDRTATNNNVSTPLTDFLSGTAAGISICLSGHPFDTLKVRLQLSDYSKHNNINLLKLIQNTIYNEGITGLYKGLSSPLLTVPLVNAIVFTSYEYAKYQLINYNVLHYSNNTNTTNELSHLQIGMCGAFAGLANSIIACPVELIKNKLQIQYEINKLHRLYKSPIHCIQSIVHVQGVRGLFTGMNSTIIREIPAYGFQFYTYELCKSIIQQYNTSQLSSIQQLICGGIGGVSCWIFSYPQDVIKSKLQTVQYTRNSNNQLIAHPYYKSRYYDGGFLSCYHHTVQQYGHRGLWHGFTPCIARAFIANAFGFYTYEYVLNYINNKPIVN